MKLYCYRGVASFGDTLLLSLLIKELDFLGSVSAYSRWMHTSASSLVIRVVNTIHLNLISGFRQIIISVGN